MCSEQYDKPFRTYDELIDILKKRNVIIPDEESAKRILSDLSSYHLINGFKQYFPTSPGTDSFDPPVSFSDFYALYLVENEINSVILKYILSVEKSFNGYFFSPIISGNLVVNVKYCDSKEHFDVQAADVLAGTLRRFLIHSHSFQETLGKINQIANVVKIVPKKKKERFPVPNHWGLACLHHA